MGWREFEKRQAEQREFARQWGFGANPAPEAEEQPESEEE